MLPRVHDAFHARGITATYETAAAGDEEKLATQAIQSGLRTIVAVGGDGTCSRVADAILRSGVPCRLGVVPSGTGNDFAKTLGVDEYTPEQVAELVARPGSSLIDVGLADGRYFLNSCGFGFDASVLDASHRVGFLKGNAVYVYSAVRQLFSYRGMEVSTNGIVGATHGKMLMVTVSNGRYLGGVFRIAPNASVVDGRLDACFFGDSNVIERIKLFVGAMRGTHLEMASVTSAAVQRLTLNFSNSQSMELDGELRTSQSRTVELRCVPRALAVIAAPGALR